MQIMLDGREVKVGDKMLSLMLGWCTVESTDDSYSYPIVLKPFKGSPIKELLTYDADGKAYKEGMRLLFWDEPTPIVAPKPKVEVKRWQWVYLDVPHNKLNVTGGTYKDEQEFYAIWRCDLYTAIQKVESTESITFE